MEGETVGRKARTHLKAQTSQGPLYFLPTLFLASPDRLGRAASKCWGDRQTVSPHCASLNTQDVTLPKRNHPALTRTGG